MNVAALAVRHARAALVAVVTLVVAGVIAAFALPSSIYPPLEFSRIVVIAKGGPRPPQVMMRTVARPVETAVMEVPGVRRVRSRSIRGAVEIAAQFDPASDMDLALQQVQNRIAEARADLPSDLELTVERLTPSVFPIMIFSLTGPLATPDLSDYGTYVVKPALARVPGSGRIEVLASDTREIEVALSPDRLAAAGLSVVDVADTLKAQNLLLPVGRFVEGGRQHLALASGLWQDVREIAQAPVLVTPTATIRVADVGTVTPGAPDRTVLITGNGRDAVSVSISQQLGANILDVESGVDAAMTELAASLPAGIHLTKVYDLAEFVRDSIANVRDAIVLGGLLSIAVLVLFLRDWRLTLVAAVTLPLAVVPTFLFLRIFGGSINLMSMGGLAVAIGLVIDDAVVVVENIHRRSAEGTEAVTDAVQQLMAPLVSSTLTTVVVFTPLGLLSGVSGQFFRALSTSLSVAVLMSLVLSVSLVPVLARWALRRHAVSLDTAGDGWLVSQYGRALSTIVRRPVVAGLFVLVLALAGAGLSQVVGTGFLPKADEGGFVVDYLTPPGSALEDTDRQVRGIEQVIAATPEVASYSRRTGSELGLFATAQNTGDLVVRLKPRSQRARSSEEVIAALRPALHEAAPLAEIEFVQLLQDMLGDLEGNPTPLEVKVFGDDPDQLARLADETEEVLQKVPGVVDVVGMQRGNPEVTWTVDPAAAGRAGLSVDDVARQMAAAWLGEVPSALLTLDRQIPVRVRLEDAFRFDPARLPQTAIKTRNGLVPLSTLARPERADGQAELLRENLRQMSLVTARLEGRDMGSAVADVGARLKSVTLPVGYSYEIGGQFTSQRQAFRELLMVFGIAAVLVFTLLVLHFQAWLPAFLVLLAAPLSLGGAFLLLWVTGTDLNVSSAMGCILLVGLVVKNGIMLLDVSERLRKDGESLDHAVVAAGRIRLRPILMTTFCTLFGLLPLAMGIGSGAELQAPLALAVIGGLALSTPVTLLALPGLYVALSGRRADAAAQ